MKLELPKNLLLQNYIDRSLRRLPSDAWRPEYGLEINCEFKNRRELESLYKKNVLILPAEEKAGEV